MTCKITKALLSLFLFTLCGCAPEKELKALLKELDYCVAHREDYASIKQNQIDSLKYELSVTNRLEDKYLLANTISLRYRSFQTDSALHYAKEALRYAHTSGDVTKIAQSQISVTRVLILMGQFQEAQERLDRIEENLPPSELDKYLNSRLALYNAMRDYCVVEDRSKHYEALAKHYRDSLIARNSLDSNNLVFFRADDRINKRMYDQALAELVEHYDAQDKYERNAGVLAYYIATIHSRLGDTQKAMGYFARSAIADIHCAVKHHKSLMRLSQILYDNGDVDRAYSYAKSSMDDYAFGNARVRTLETTDMFFLIGNAYQKKQAQSTKILIFILFITAIIATALLTLTIKLHRTNRVLEDANNKIKSISAQLRETNIIKEEYIGLYMTQCAAYLEKMNKVITRLRSSIRKGMDSPALLEETKRSINIDEEVDDFYRSFDMTILHLFPNFPDKLDDLLIPEARGLYSQKGDGLRPECRIFALIRLGITDSSKIAQFLRYSLPTIYNYRTKLRNKALGPREEFEKAVMRIGR